MMLVQLMQDASCLADFGSWDFGSWLDLSHWRSSFDLSVLAQQFDTDVFKGTRTILNNFVKSGQLWAFLTGLIVGYILRSLTNYG